MVVAPRLNVHLDRTVSFNLRFDANANYLNGTPSTQSDWNKVMGLTSNRIHHNSLRIGWRWNPAAQVIELGFYGYIQGQRIDSKLASVPLGQSIACELHLDNNGMRATAGGVTRDVRQPLGLSGWFPTTTWLLRTAYFGGTETAPHDIDLSVSGITLH